MRARSIEKDLEVYAVAGTHTAVLSFDCKQKPVGCLGFASVMQLQPDVDAAALPVDAVAAFFSPRSSTRMLDVYADLVEGASEMACGIFPFNIDQRFRSAFDQERDFPRYIIVDKASNTFQPNDRDLDIAAGAYIKTPIDQWVKEKSAGGLFYGGTDFVHNKLLIVDPLGASPCVVVGSANFSEPSIDENDENLLVLKGPRFRREADIYLTEFIRLFDHFNFRDWLASPDADFQPFLEEAPAANGRSWIDKYFDDPAFLSWKRKMAFKRMVVP